MTEILFAIEVVLAGGIPDVMDADTGGDEDDAEGEATEDGAGADAGSGQ